MKCVDILHTYGIRLFALMIAGSDHDTVKTIRQTSQFCFDRDIELVQTTSHTPLPGTRLYDELQQDDRLIVKDWKKEIDIILKHL
jgi:hypothetical protein